MMKRKTIFFGGSTILLSVLLLACAVQKERQEPVVAAAPVEISFSVYDAIPHCGGAAPDPNRRYPILQAIPQMEIWVFAEDAEGKRGKPCGTFVTDDKGEARMHLPLGKYQLWSPGKLKTLEEFIRLNKPVQSQFYTYKDNACFEEWKNSPDMKFEVQRAGNIRVVYPNKCFTGSNPCMDYAGPYPP